MSSPLVHPRKNANRPQFYPHLVTIGKLAGSATSNDERNYKFTATDGLDELACAYGPKEGALPDMWQSDASGGEVILLAAIYGTIKRRDQAKLTINGEVKVFNITDVLPADGATLLVVTPVK